MFNMGSEEPITYMQDFIRSDYYKVPIYFHDNDNTLFFSSIAPKGNACDFAISKSTQKGIRWTTEGREQPIIAFGSSNDFIYFVYSDYSDPKTDVISNPMKKLVVNDYGVSLNENDNIALIKVKFKL